MVFGLSTELFRVQMRALATGSDGLSDVAEPDLLAIVLPRLTDAAVRSSLEKRLETWMEEGETLKTIVAEGLRTAHPNLDLQPRPSHVAQV